MLQMFRYLGYRNFGQLVIRLGMIGGWTAFTVAVSFAQSISGVRVSPVSLEGGTSATGTVTLSSNAGTAGVFVALKSSNRDAVVPSSVTVPAGSKTASFSVKTSPVPTDLTITVTGTVGSSSDSTSLQIKARSLVSVTLNPANVIGGMSTTGVVALSGPALERISIPLTSDSSSATVPKTVVIPAGASRASFQISTTDVANSTVATISATLGSVSKSVSMSINASDPVSNITSSPAVLGGNVNLVTVTLSAPSGPNGVVIALSSSDRCAPVPETLTIAPGQLAVQVAIKTNSVLKPTPVTVWAKTDGRGQSTKFNVDPAFKIKVSPDEIIGGITVTGTVTLAGPAPAGGLTFNLGLSNFDASISAPPTVTIPAGAKSASFAVGTSFPLSDGVSAMIKALNTDGLSDYTLVKVDRQLKVAAIVLAPNSVSGGAISAVKVTLNAFAPSGGYVVKLSSSSPTLAKLPATVTIPAGSCSAVAKISTSTVSSFKSSQISASFAGSTLATSLWVTQALPGTSYAILNPDNWSYSIAGAISGSGQAGLVQMLTTGSDIAVQHAALWSGTNSSFVDLHPLSWNGSYVTGASGDLQVGNVNQILGSGHAALWNGSASSFLDLNPAGSESSTANAISGKTIVGSSGTDLEQHATLWAGSDFNAVDLSPSGLGPSVATATDGKSIVGYIGTAGILGSSAALWTNPSSESYLNLNPIGWSSSGALGVSGGNQVGWVGNVTWVTGHGTPYPVISGPFAARWSGTSSSFVNLDVPGDLTSNANAVSGNIAVGYVQCAWPYGTHAALWLDDATTFIDLVALSRATWTNSSANAIYTDSTGIYVAGHCDTGAIMWHIPASQLSKLRVVIPQKTGSPNRP